MDTEPNSIPAEIEGVNSRPVPGFPRYRADDTGCLWQWGVNGWARFGTGPGDRTTFIDATGDKVGMFKHKAVCMAWHGTRPKSAQVRFRDGDRANLCPDNISWLDMVERSPLPMPAPGAPRVTVAKTAPGSPVDVVVTCRVGMRVNVRAGTVPGGIVVSIEPEGGEECSSSA